MNPRPGCPKDCYYIEMLESRHDLPLTHRRLKPITPRFNHTRSVEALEILRRFKRVNGFEPPIITAGIGYAEGASGDRKAALEVAHTPQRASAHNLR